MRETDHLTRKLAEQLALLRGLCDLYDSKTPAAALSIATCLRVLLHDSSVTGRGGSHALLPQMGILGDVRFCDTSTHLDPRNLIPMHNGLVVFEVTGGVGGRYIPRCSGNAEYDNDRVRFPEWWSMLVLRDHSGREWTRKQLILTVTNKEGGAHLDPTRPEKIRALEDENSMGMVFVGPTGEQPFLNNPIPPSVRQIAREVLLTLDAG